jgi:hypothetical protein
MKRGWRIGLRPISGACSHCTEGPLRKRRYRFSDAMNEWRGAGPIVGPQGGPIHIGSQCERRWREHPGLESPVLPIPDLRQANKPRRPNGDRYQCAQIHYGPCHRCPCRPERGLRPRCCSEQ